jgi:hypothetical protein
MNSVHVAKVIADRVNGFEAIGGSMIDSIVAGSIKRNRDGSITIRCQISVDDAATGERWALEDKTIRLPKKKEAARG